MTTTGRAWRVAVQRKVWSAIVPAALALSGCQTPTPPMAPPEPPKPELSYLNIAIGIPLQPIEKAAEEEAPRAVGVEPFKYQMGGGAAPPACGMDGGYSITRAPLAMSGSGEVITTSVDLSYWLKGRKQVPCPGPLTTVSCGTDGEPPRTANVSINTTITILPDLTTSVHSSLGPVVPGSRCVLHPIEQDVTDEVVGGFDTALRKMLPAVDKRVAAGLDLRKRVTAGWARMSEPTELRPKVWLALNPEGIGVVPVTVAEGRAAHRGPAAVKTGGERGQEATV